MTEKEKMVLLERIRRIDPKRVPIRASAVITEQEVAQAFKEMTADRVRKADPGWKG